MTNTKHSPGPWFFSKANARLIAAAPDQHVELTTAVEIIEKYGSDPTECVRRLHAWLPRGCAAIAKATGCAA